MPNIEMDSVVLDYDNNRYDLIKRIKATYEDIGQIRPIYVLEDWPVNILFEGSATYLALKEARAEEIMAVVLKKEDKAGQALINLILSHEEYDRSLVNIAEKVKEASKYYSALKLSKYLRHDKDAVQDLIDLLDFDWSAYEVEETDKQENLFEI